MLGLSHVTPRHFTSALVSAFIVAYLFVEAWAPCYLGWLESEAPSYPVRWPLLVEAP